MAFTVLSAASFITTVPFEIALIEPSDAPLQETFVPVAVKVTAAGSVIVTVVVAVQNPLALPLAAEAVTT